ncbi:MAG: NAD-dependent deacetylase [Gammaproteobacteria bacterium]|nr:NAD-dependent deacetylase [Gammaproteobacteria bacterium]
MTHDAQIEALREMIEEVDDVVVFTGAGVSTESGIPDFRSPGTGIWNKIKPTDFSDFIGSEEVRRTSWQRKFAGSDKIEEALPNRGHRAIAQLIDIGKASVVITQNVDNLHQQSGVPAEKVLELHGNARFATCLTCSQRYELADLKAQFEQHGEVQPCVVCGGIIKTATISFGQELPQDVLMSAAIRSERCELFLAIGSSLIVYPAASLPELAHRNGAKLVILNREATPFDDIADLVLHMEIGPTLGDVVGVN